MQKLVQQPFATGPIVFAFKRFNWFFICSAFFCFLLSEFFCWVLNSNCVLLLSAFFCFLLSQGSSVAKKTAVFYRLLTSWMLHGQDNRYIYRVCELRDAPWPRQPSYYNVFELKDAPWQRKPWLDLICYLDRCDISKHLNGKMSYECNSSCKFSHNES